jgi:hypothetical protein
MYEFDYQKLSKYLDCIDPYIILIISNSKLMSCSISWIWKWLDISFVLSTAKDIMLMEPFFFGMLVGLICA